MRPSKYLPVVLACLFSLPALAKAATGKNDSATNKLAARLQTCAKPVWPAESLRRGEEGAVTLAYLIGMDGRVIESIVEKSSGHPLLDLAAQDGLAKCLFASPETIGRNEPTWTKMMYLWTLEESETPEEKKGRFERDQALAAAGDAAALYNMSWRYMAGDAGVQKNIPESLRLLRKSAELGYQPAQASMAIELFTGSATDHDIAKAIEWAKKAAMNGDPNAQVLLATILNNAPEELEDFGLMLDMLEKAAAQGDAAGKGRLGILLIDGGGDKEKKRGLQLVIDAAEAKDRLAQHVLAEIYEEGELLPKDDAKTRALFERSAAGGYPPAKDALFRLQH